MYQKSRIRKIGRTEKERLSQMENNYKTVQTEKQAEILAKKRNSYQEEDRSTMKQSAERTYEASEVTYPISYEFNGLMFRISVSDFEDNLFTFTLIDDDDEETDCVIMYYLYKENGIDDVFLYSADCNRKGMGRFTLNALLNYLTDPSQPKIVSGEKRILNDETEVSLQATASWDSDTSGTREWSKAQRNLVNYYLKASFVPTEPIDIANTYPLPINLRMNGTIGNIKHAIDNYDVRGSASIGGRRKLTKKKRTTRKSRKTRKSRRRR